jgi:hypothetical protein
VRQRPAEHPTPPVAAAIAVDEQVVVRALVLELNATDPLPLPHPPPGLLRPSAARKATPAGELLDQVIGPQPYLERTHQDDILHGRRLHLAGAWRRRS